MKSRKAFRTYWWAPNKFSEALSITSQLIFLTFLCCSGMRYSAKAFKPLYDLPETKVKSKVQQTYALHSFFVHRSPLKVNKAFHIFHTPGQQLISHMSLFVLIKGLSSGKLQCANWSVDRENHFPEKWSKMSQQNSKWPTKTEDIFN